MPRTDFYMQIKLLAFLLPYKQQKSSFSPLFHMCKKEKKFLRSQLFQLRFDLLDYHTINSLFRPVQQWKLVFLTFKCFFPDSLFIFGYKNDICLIKQSLFRVLLNDSDAKLSIAVLIEKSSLFQAALYFAYIF